jgi:hypothetical protein
MTDDLIKMLNVHVEGVRHYLHLQIGKPLSKDLVSAPEIALDNLQREVGAAMRDAAQGARITDDQIKYMVDRFLGWTLPSDFNPDGGISFTPPKPSCFYMPIGTNLFDVFQAEAMVRYMIDGMPFPAIQEYVSEMCQSIDHMKVTPTQKEFAKAVLRAAIEFANARHGMHASQNAKAAAPSSTVRGGV